MATWTTAQDVIDRWVGSGAPTDEDLLEILLSDAETVILAEFPRIQERIDDESLSLDAVRLVTVRMVTRVLRNPDMATYLQQTTGPFGQARNFGDKVDIWLSTEERAIIAPTTGRKAFSVDTGAYATDAYARDDLDPYDPLWRSVE